MIVHTTCNVGLLVMLYTASMVSMGETVLGDDFEIKTNAWVILAQGETLEDSELDNVTAIDVAQEWSGDIAFITAGTAADIAAHKTLIERAIDTAVDVPNAVYRKALTGVEIQHDDKLSSGQNTKRLTYTTSTFWRL